MKIAGIIAEYNPFHNGHLYQIQEARRITGCDVLIVVMSGNFLQRGVPAVMDKWTRARWAGAYGADLVIEMPVTFSTQSADYFAQGGVELLNQLKVDTLVFGVESGTAAGFRQAAANFIDQESELIEQVQSSNRQTTYAQAMDDLLSKEEEISIDLSEPNNMLGFAYAKYIYKNDYPIELCPITRKDAQYHDMETEDKSEIASATAIRHLLDKSKPIDRFVPPLVAKELPHLPLVSMADYWSALQYKIWSSDDQYLAQIFQMEPGLEHKLKQAVLEVSTYDELMEKIKSKHLSYNRLNRVLIYILIDLTAEVMSEEVFQGPRYIRLLHVNQKAQEYLNKVKTELSLPIISTVKTIDETLIHWDIKAGELYRLANISEISKQDFTRNPYQTVDNKASYQYTK